MGDDREQPRYLSELLRDGYAPRLLKEMRMQNPEFDAIMAELVAIKRLVRRNYYQSTRASEEE